MAKPNPMPRVREAVGTWAYVEAVVPKWVKGCEEPIKIAYDAAWDASSRKRSSRRSLRAAGQCREWRRRRLAHLRGHNRWKSAEQCGHHPHPGTHPMVVTTERDWGGWRVPGAEYDLDPYRIERQAEIIVRAPIFMKLLEEFVEYADQEPENLSDDLTKLAQIARRIISEVSQ